MQGFLEGKGLAGNVPIFMSAQESGMGQLGQKGDAIPQ